MKNILTVLTMAGVFSCGLFMATQQASADLLAGWDVDGVDVDDGTGIDEGTSPYTFTASTIGANIGTAELRLSADVNPSTASDQYGFGVSGADEQTTLAGAISANHYWEFTLTAESGFFLNLESISMNGDATSTGADDVALMSNIDGFVVGNEIASLTGVAGETGGLDTDSSGFGAPIDLSGAQYQEITSVTFRMYGYNTTSASGRTRIRNLSGDDLEIEGTTTVIPEPGTMALFLMGFGAIAAIRRRMTPQGAWWV